MRSPLVADVPEVFLLGEEAAVRELAQVLLMLFFLLCFGISVARYLLP